MIEDYIEIDKIKEYFDNPAISQSDLIALSKSPYIFKQKKDNKDDYTSDALVLGSAVDCLLTDKDNFGHRFHVLSAKKPTGQMLEYTETLFRLSNSHSDEFRIFYTPEIEEMAYNTIGFKRDSLDKVKERFVKEGLDYYHELEDNIKKIKISFEIYEQAIKIKEDLLLSKYTHNYFTYGEYEEIFFQTPIYFTYDLVECKALVDIIKISHKEKTIRLIDIKTTEFLPNFRDSVWKYRYDLQAAWYTLSMNSFKEGYYSNYIMLPFTFLVAEKCCGHKPWVFEITKDIISIGRSGGIIMEKNIKGYNQLIKIYKTCKAKEQWDYPVEMLEKGKISL